MGMLHRAPSPGGGKNQIEDIVLIFTTQNKKKKKKFYCLFNHLFNQQSEVNQPNHNNSQ